MELLFASFSRKVVLAAVGLGLGSSFTSQLAVKTGQGNGKSLKCTHWVVVVHGENVFSHTAKLHHYIVSWERKPQMKDKRTSTEFSASKTVKQREGGEKNRFHFHSERKG